MYMYMYMDGLVVKNPPEIQEMQVHRLDPWVGKIDPLEKKMATHSSNVVWGNPWTEEPGGLQFMGSQESYIGMYVCITCPLDSTEIKPINLKGNLP